MLVVICVFPLLGGVVIPMCIRFDVQKVVELFVAPHFCLDGYPMEECGWHGYAALGGCIPRCSGSGDFWLVGPLAMISGH